MSTYIAQEDYLRQKQALRDAQAKPEGERRAAVEATVLATLAQWRGKAWPDDWSLWQRALDDVRHYRDQVSLDDFATQAARAERERIAALYPEHERQSLVAGKSQAIGEFLDWLNEQGYAVAEYDQMGNWHPLHRSIESWLAQYFDIDPVKIDREKRAMLDAMRALHDDEVER